MKKTKTQHQKLEEGVSLTSHICMDGHVSPSSSPPTPPSPLPISVAPGNLKYYFSPSPSSSPPFSPPPSTHTSAGTLPLLSHKLPTPPPLHAFSLELDSTTSSCLQDLLEWFIQKCCDCCLKIHRPAE